jgi:acyl-CoA reductase-like NAD-dependent aldehyde dehydrogenase/ABC-type branched-subunit amino acid transport system ATPase component
VTALLQVADLSAGYGASPVLTDVSLQVADGALVVLVGANGAGKTTLLSAIAGVIPSTGTIRFDGRELTGDLTRETVSQRVARGMVLVPEGRQLFGEMTVRENLELGGYLRSRRERAESMAHVLTLFPRLGERLDQAAGTMSGGEQQMVALARALVSRPRLLMLDEPSLGLAPKMIGELFRLVRRIRDQGTAVLLVEQNVRQALAVADYSYVLERGSIVAEGAGADLLATDLIQRAYLGSDVAGVAPGGGASAFHPTGQSGGSFTIRVPGDREEGPHMFDTPMLVNNQDTGATGGKTYNRPNPMTGEVATRAAAASIADANAAVDAAAAAFPAWAALGPSERRLKLLKAADILSSRVDEAVARMMSETGSTPPWAGFNVMLASGMLREAAAMTTQVGGEVIPSDKPGCLAFSYRQPAGVVLGIAPWNAPIILGVRAIAVPLACGNTVVLKASETCPATHRLIGEVMREAGLPPGVVNVVTNAPADAPAIVDALIAHPAVKRVNFTGSTKVGKIIAERAARHLKPVLLELGGKAPLIVLDDADLDAAVNAAAFGAYANQGQICMSTELAIVDESVADAFVQRMAAKAASLPAGDPRAHVVLGPMIGTEAADRVEGLIKEAVAAGAKLAAGGTREGIVLTATVLDRVTPAMRLYGEESFGPVLCVVRVRGVDEAVRVANASEYGLSAAVFGRDVLRAFEVAKRIQSGICHINGPTVHDEAQMPFGGMKGSGYGRFGGKAAIDQFTDLRWITIEDGKQAYPF